jgi:hypothetical protein
LRRALTIGTRRLELYRRADRRPDDEPLRFRDAAAARQLARTLAQDPVAMAALRRVTVETAGAMPAGATDDEVLDWLAVRLQRRQLFLGDLGERLALAAPAGEEEEEQEKPKPPPPPIEKTHWVKFKIQDDVTGKPVPNVTLKVRLPNNSLVSRTTNADGMIAIDSLGGGTCSVEAVTDNDALAVTKVQ